MTARLLLVGPPNVGKSALFGALTRRYATVSNYPGTTVEVARAPLGAGECLDTPGLAGLVPASEEEAVTVRILLERAGDTVVAVVDARDVERGISFVLALGDLDHRFVVALNCHDEALDARIGIDAAALEAALGVPVVPTVAVTREGVGRLRAALAEARPIAARADDPPDVARALDEAEALVAPGPHRRARARLALAGAEGVLPCAAPALTGIRRRLGAAFGVSLPALAARGRAEAARRIAAAAVRRPDRRPTRLGRIAGDLAVHPVWGWPVLATILWGIYEIVGVFAAGTLVDLLEEDVFGARVVPGVARLLSLLPDGPVERLLLVDPAAGPAPGAGLIIGPYGLVSMGLTYALAIILPVVSFFFLAFAVLEDTGYLPRLSVMLDRTFRAMGLNGRAVLPLVLGLGCDTMATMTTRILPSRKERILVTFLLALAIPCSAQLGVLAVLAGLLSGAALLAFVAAVVGVAVAAGAIGARVLPGRPAPFLLEIPPVRRPRLANVAAKTVARTEWYLREAVPLFLLGTLVLWLLDAAGALERLYGLLAPLVVGVLGLPREAARAFVMGFLRRDYGAAGLFDIFAPALRAGSAPPAVEADLVVAMTTITLFVPCLANLLVIGKERGWRGAVAVLALTTIIAFSAGGATRLVLGGLGW